MGFRRELHRRASELQRTVVLAEGWDERVGVAARLLDEAGIARTVVLQPGRLPRVEDVAALLRERRPDKVRDDASAAKLASNPIVCAVGLVALGEADVAVAGATCPTAEVVRAALWLLGAAPGVETVSSAFYMYLPAPPLSPPPSLLPGERGEWRGERALLPHPRAGAWGASGVLTFTDAGVVPDPTAAQLAEIALSAARDRRRIVGDEPVVAFLSYSTKGSAAGPRVAKVAEAVERFGELAPDIVCDGELQGDAAIVPEVAERKASGSPVAGRANILVFPDLDSGNIAYKLVQRLAGAVAVGPIIQGLAKPVADLSRGASADDIVDVAAVAILQTYQPSFTLQEDR